MMQTNEIRQQLQHIGQTIHQAADACTHASGVPMDLKDCVQQMDQRSLQMEQDLPTAEADWMVECVEDLEEIEKKSLQITLKTLIRP